MNLQPKRKYTEEEYLQMELTASYKSEYYKGEIFPTGEIEGKTPEAMAGAMPSHNAISSNIIISLGTKLRGKGCMTFNSDQRLFIPATGLYTYPDISVYCHPLQYHDRMSLVNPVMLIEILSKVSEGYDRGSKFEMYRSVSSLSEYVMVDSQRVHVELWRKENSRWMLVMETNDVQEQIEFKSIENNFSLQDFYFEALQMISNLSQPAI